MKKIILCMALLTGGVFAKEQPSHTKQTTNPDVATTENEKATTNSMQTKTENANTNSTTADSDLAHVAILKFVNASHSEAHEWVENSLPDAINISMVNKFEFIRTNPEKVQMAQTQEKIQGDTYSLEAIRRIAKKTDSDIIIYGYFKLAKEKDMIFIHAVVYNAAGNKIIGTVTQKSELTNRIFKAIDIIAEGIVKHIYRYALQSEEVKGENNQKEKKKLRLLVLVPSYKSKKDKARALKELEDMKHELNGKYDGEFITIFEYYDRFRVPQAERNKVNAWAKKRKATKITQWLVDRGVKDAFIILVRRKKVSITPIVEGEPQEKVTYKTNDKPKEKKMILAKISKTAKIPKKKKKPTKKVSLKKSTFKTTPTNAIRLLGSGFKTFGQVDSYVDYTVGGQINISFPFLFSWLNPYFSMDGHYVPAKISANKSWFAGAKGGLLFSYLHFSKFRFSAFAAGGAYTGKVGSSSLFTVAAAEAGNIIDFYITSRICISFSISGIYMFDKDVPAILAGGYFGVGYGL